MNTSTQPAPGPVPRRSPIALIAPFAVALATLALLAWSAWPSLRPVREVAVTQAVFDRTTAVVSEITNADPTTTTKTVQAPGWLEADPWVVACTALADGVVESMEVREGDRVEAGDVVARLVDDDARLRLERTEAALGEAQAGLVLAQADLSGATTDWDEPVERERAVASGRASLARVQGELDRLPSRITESRAVLAGLENELVRTEQSFEQGAANELELIRIRQSRNAQFAAVMSMEAMRPVLSAEVDRLASELRAAERGFELRVDEKRALETARAMVLLAESSVRRARAERDEAALELERMTVRSPITGYVQRRLKAPGDKAMLGMDNPRSAQLALLYNHEALRVRVDVPLADASYVRVGQACEVIVEVLPDRTFTGEVLRITHEADLQKNTLEVQVKVLDPAPILRPEMLTRVRFIGGADRVKGGTDEQPEAGVLVPTGSISNGSVWVVRDRTTDRGVVRRLGVTIESENTDGWALVRGPLSPGDLIIATPEAAREGERVRFVSAEGGAS